MRVRYLVVKCTYRPHSRVGGVVAATSDRKVSELNYADAKNEYKWANADN